MVVEDVRRRWLEGACLSRLSRLGKRRPASKQSCCRAHVNPRGKQKHSFPSLTAITTTHTRPPPPPQRPRQQAYEARKSVLQRVAAASSPQSQSTQQPNPFSHTPRHLGPITQLACHSTHPHPTRTALTRLLSLSLPLTSLSTGVGMSATFNPPIAALIAWTIICGSVIVLTNVAKFTKYIDKDNAGYVVNC